jgi:hypothetical protein
MQLQSEMPQGKRFLAIAPLVVAESATREWLLIRFSIIITNGLIRSAGGGVLSSCGIMQLRTLQTTEAPGPTVSYIVLLAILAEIKEMLPRFARNV